jgi:hypothetical protein
MWRHREALIEQQFEEPLHVRGAQDHLADPITKRLLTAVGQSPDPRPPFAEQVDGLLDERMTVQADDAVVEAFRACRAESTAALAHARPR